MRREKLLAEMVQVVVPWGRLEVLTTPPALRCVARAAHHAAAVRLANEALENAMYDSRSMRRSVGIVPGASVGATAITLC